MSDLLDTRQRQWLEARVQFFRKKTRSSVRDALPSFDLEGERPVVEGAWSGIALTWGTFGAQASPAELTLEGGKAILGDQSLAGQRYDFVCLGNVLTLAPEGDKGRRRELKLLTLGNELVGTWQDGVRTREVYFLRGSSGQCERRRFSELGELGAVFLIASALAFSLLYFLRFPVWTAGALIAGVVAFSIHNVKNRRRFHTLAWELAFHTLTKRQLQAAARETLGPGVADLLAPSQSLGVREPREKP